MAPEEDPAESHAELKASTALSLLFGATAYLAITAAKVPRLAYLPFSGEWRFNPPAATLGMDWYFRALVTLSACLVGAVVGSLGRAKSLSPRVKHLLLWTGILVLSWAMLFTSLALVQSPRTWQNTSLQRISQ